MSSQDDQDRDWAVKSEDTPENKVRLASLVRARLRARNFHLYPPVVDEVLSQVVIDELVVLRKRSALMLDLVRQQYPDGLTDSQLERVAFVLLVHSVDSDGEIRLPPEVEEG